MELNVKYFNELTVYELFDIYKLRCDVFVVEQNCPYKEVDDIDKEAVHIFLADEGNLLSYCRLFRKSENTFSIGRVVSSQRGKGYGSEVIREAIHIAKSVFNAESIEIEAQVYAKSLYKKHGFKSVGEEFDLDGIPHIKMCLKLNQEV